MCRLTPFFLLLVVSADAFALMDSDGDGLIEIGTADELVVLRDDINGDGQDDGLIATVTVPHTQCRPQCRGYELTRDIILDAHWIPIGSVDRPYTGLLVGNGYAIKGLTINSSSHDYVGLFAAIEGATIRNLTIHSPQINGKSYTGALTGKAHNAVVQSIALIGAPGSEDVRGYGKNVGGLAGVVEQTQVSNVSSNLTVWGGNRDDQDNIGGVIGMAAKNSTLSEITMHGLVIAGDSTETNGPDIVGGIVGYLEGKVLQNSQMRGEVHSKGTRSFTFGGLVGFQGEATIIRHSGMRGRMVVQGEYIANYGGISGMLDHKALIINSWAEMTLMSQGEQHAHIGGLVGYQRGGNIVASWALVHMISEGNFHSGYGGLIGSQWGGFVGQSWSNGRLTSRWGQSRHYGGLIGEMHNGVVSNVWSGVIMQHSDASPHFGALIGIRNDGTVSGRNYYQVHIGDARNAGTNVTKKSAIARTLPEIAALRGGGGNPLTHTQWEKVDAHTPQELQWVAQYCDRNGNGVIERSGSARENIPSNRVWDYSDQHTLPAIRCTGYLERQRPDQDGDNIVDIIDVDSDQDGLIDIRDRGHLIGMRDDLDGDGIDDGRLSDVAPFGYFGCPPAGCAGYELTTDVHLQGVWESVGDIEYPYSSVFEGNGHKIAGILINRPKDDYIGFFATLQNATVRNVNFITPYIVGRTYTGTLTGRATDSTVSNVVFTGDNNSESAEIFAYGSDVGGIAGHLVRSSLINISSTLTVRGGITDEADRIGGAIGTMDKGSVIRGVIVAGTVLAGEVNVENGPDLVGGLVGLMDGGTIIHSGVYGHVGSIGHYSTNYGGLVGNQENGAIIRSSWVKGIISSNGIYNDHYGGIVGKQHDGLIANSWARVVIKSQKDNNRRYGGLVGEQSGVLQNCWSAGTISSGGRHSSYYGGIVGYQNAGTIRHVWSAVNLLRSFALSSEFYGKLVGHRAAGEMQGRNYYVVTRKKGFFAGSRVANSMATSLTQTAITALSGGDGLHTTHTQWDKDVTGLPPAQQLLLQYCDTDANGAIQATERNENNRIWDYGSSEDIPVIRCTGAMSDQRLPLKIKTQQQQRLQLSF